MHQRDRLAAKNDHFWATNSASFVTLFHFTALYATRAYMSTLAVTLGATDAQVGFPSIAYSAVQVALAISFGHIVDCFGPRIPAMIGSGILCVGIGSMGIANHWVQLVFAALLLGVGHTMVILGTQGSAVASEQKKATASNVGWVMFASSGGMFVGPIIGGFLMDYVTDASFFLFAFIGVGAVVFSAWLPSGGEAAQAKQEKENIRAISLFKNKNITIAILSSALVLFCQETTLTYFPVYAGEIGISASAIGTIIGIRGIAAMLVRPSLGRLVERYSIERMMFICLFGSGVAIVGHAIFRSYLTLLLISGCYGLFCGLAAPMALVLIAAATPKAHRGKAVSLRVTCNYIGQGASSAIFGVISNVLGFAPVFWICGCLLVFFASYVRKNASKTA